MSDTRWLERRSQGWYCVKDVPRPLRAVLGKKRFVASLHTRDIRAAMARRHVALAGFEAEIAKARGMAGADAVQRSAMEWRAALQVFPEEARSVHFEHVAAEAEAIEEKHGHATAKDFYNLATGKTTPLLHYIDQWLAEGGARGPVAERTQRQYRSDLTELETWARASGVAPTIEAFTAKTVGRFITEAMVGTGANRKTSNRKISAASSYWRWLAKRGVVEGNPWQGQSLSKAKRREAVDTEPRPFTDTELATLLSGNPDAELSDAIPIAALSGMRLEEIYRLTVVDCTGGWFNIRRSKTTAGVRRVPIHTAVAPIIARRTQGYLPAAYLFPEAGPLRPGRERSMAVSKRFGRYRIRVGVDERPDGQRHSLVNFHSLRRWFITQARHGFDRAVVAALVGHEVGNLTDDVYSGGPLDSAKVACVASVRLPSP